MFDPWLRPAKDRLLTPLAEAVGGVDPGSITGAALAVGLGAAWAGYSSAFMIGLGLWVLCRILDGLDGLVARTQGTASELGGLLDLVADYIVYAAVPVALALRPAAPELLPAAALLLLSTFYVNAAAWMVSSALLERRGHARGPTAITIPEGLVSGGETVVFYGLFFLLPGWQVELFLLMALLTAITVVQRVVWAVRTFGAPKRSPIGIESDA